MYGRSKNERGRPARDENDTQSNLCTIRDAAIEPFFIVKRFI